VWDLQNTRQKVGDRTIWNVEVIKTDTYQKLLFKLTNMFLHFQVIFFQCTWVIWSPKRAQWRHKRVALEIWQTKTTTGSPSADQPVLLSPSRTPFKFQTIILYFFVLHLQKQKANNKHATKIKKRYRRSRTKSLGVCIELRAIYINKVHISTVSLVSARVTQER